MFAADRSRWLTPKNVLIAFLLCSQTATLFWLMWNEIDMQRHPAMITEIAPVMTPKVKP